MFSLQYPKLMLYSLSSPFFSAYSPEPNFLVPELRKLPIFHDPTYAAHFTEDEPPLVMPWVGMHLLIKLLWFTVRYLHAWSAQHCCIMTIILGVNHNAILLTCCLFSLSQTPRRWQEDYLLRHRIQPSPRLFKYVIWRLCPTCWRHWGNLLVLSFHKQFWLQFRFNVHCMFKSMPSYFFSGPVPQIWCFCHSSWDWYYGVYCIRSVFHARKLGETRHSYWITGKGSLTHSHPELSFDLLGFFSSDSYIWDSEWWQRQFSWSFDHGWQLQYTRGMAHLLSFCLFLGSFGLFIVDLFSGNNLFQQCFVAWKSQYKSQRWVFRCIQNSKYGASGQNGNKHPW